VDVFAQGGTFNKPYIGPTSNYAGTGQGSKWGQENKYIQTHA
jgi:hypothetical protein